MSDGSWNIQGVYSFVILTEDIAEFRITFQKISIEVIIERE